MEVFLGLNCTILGEYSVNKSSWTKRNVSLRGWEPTQHTSFRRPKKVLIDSSNKLGYL